MPWLYFSKTRVLSIKTFSGPGLVILSLYTSVAKPKLFIFGSGSIFVHNFGSDSSYSHILPHKLFYNIRTVHTNRGRN